MKFSLPTNCFTIVPHYVCHLPHHINAKNVYLSDVMHWDEQLIP